MVDANATASGDILHFSVASFAYQQTITRWSHNLSAGLEMFRPWGLILCGSLCK